MKSWLVSSGIAEERITLSPGRNWLRFDGTIEELENLLHADYSIYTHDATGTKHLACESYSVPADLQPHIDMITPTIHFDAKLSRPAKREEPSKRNTPVHAPGTPGSGHGPKQGKIISAPTESTEASQAASPSFTLGK